MSELIKKAAELTRLEHEGERVITFAQMDEMHARKPGSTGRTFRRHRGELRSGEDYFEITEAGLLVRLQIERKRGEKLILLTETGYLMLVKFFRDKRAVEVHRTLVRHYFKSKAEASQPPQQSQHFDMELFASIMEKCTERTVRDGLEPVGVAFG